MSPWSVHAVPVDEHPGLTPATRGWLEGRWDPPTATPPLTGFRAGIARGAAWTDPGFAEELREHHRILGAPEASLRNLDRLLSGEAGCVITGQQPSLFGGAMMTVSKVTGAIALAAAWEADGVACVPVYWCGADDSDFAEVRAAWLWSQDEAAPFRAELPSRLWTEGMRVGDVAGTPLAELERAALRRSGEGPGAGLLASWEASLPGDLDLGQRAQAWLLRALGDRGVVVVDARSPRLRALGRELFAGYTAQHDTVADALLARSRSLREGGWDPPLADTALRSGLFRLEGGRRTKLEPRELTGATERFEVAPSVMLRPVWQDALLAPAAAVLGPSEFAYHAQLGPLYEALDVTAAAPVPRPHLTLLPPGVDWPSVGPAPATWLNGGEDLLARLGHHAVERAWGDALRRLQAQRERAREEFLEQIGPEASAVAGAWRDQDARWHARWAADLQDPALARGTREGGLGPWVARWMAPRGIPQERILAAVTGWWRCGEDFASVLDQVQAHYADAVRTRGSVGFVATLGEST